MNILNYVLSGLVQLIIKELLNNKADIEKLVVQFIESLLSQLAKSGNADVVHKIQAVVSSADTH